MCAPDANGGLLLTPRLNVWRDMDPNLPAVKTEKDRLWRNALGFMRTSPDGELGKYLGVQRKTMAVTPFRIWQPLCKVGTTSYQDNGTVLDRIDDVVRAQCSGHKATIIVGDQQTFDRMVKLRRASPGMYSKVIPFNGEMHYTAHFLHAGWRLYYDKLLQWWVRTLNMDGALKEDWTVKNWGYYDDFMMIFVSGFMQWVNAVLPPDDASDFDTCLERAQGNADLTCLLHFMYEVGLPYIGLRQLFREQSTPEMRARSLLYYNMGMHMCRTKKANKYQYSMLSVHAVFFHRNAIPSLRNIWEHMSTVTLRGVPGRHIPLDHLCEKVNNAAKKMLRGIITVPRLQELIPCLNFLMPAEAEYLHLTGAHKEDAKCFSGKAHRAASIREVVSWLNGVVGEDWETATSQKEDLTFLVGTHASDATLPWNLVADKHHDWLQYVWKVQHEIEHLD